MEVDLKEGQEPDVGIAWPFSLRPTGQPFINSSCILSPAQPEVTLCMFYKAMPT